MSLNDIADAGRRKREAAAQARATAAAAAEAARAASWSDRERRAEALGTYTVVRSLTRAINVAAVFGALSGGAVVMSAIVGLLGLPDESGPRVWVFVAPTVVILPAGAAYARMVHVKRRDVAFRAARPYPVHGYQQSLDWGRSYPSSRFHLHFLGDPPPLPLLRDALASLPEKTTVESIEDGVAKCEVEGEGSKFDGHRYWLPRWFYNACETVFDPLHAEYPLEKLDFPQS